MYMAQAAAFPTLTISLQGITLTVKGAQYVRAVQYQGQTYYCMGIGQISQSFMILGDYIMQVCTDGIYLWIVYCLGI